MNALLLALTFTVVSQVDLLGHFGSNWIRFSRAPCTDPKAVAAVTQKAEDPANFYAATIYWHERSLVGCWRTMGGGYFLIDEDGKSGSVPARDMKPARDI